MSELRIEPSEKYLSTREAAARLGVALSTVQAWVENGVLPAWKTAGGHRRIPASKVDEVFSRRNPILENDAAPELLKILVVEDDAVQRELYHRHFTDWRLPLQLWTAEDGFEGLLLIGEHKPDLIIVDLVMPEMDGFKMIRKLKAQPGALPGGIIAVTALTPEEIEARGDLPTGIPVYPKPIPFVALRLLVEYMCLRLPAKT